MQKVIVSLVLLGIANLAVAANGNALVFGGTGRLGAPIVRLLLEAGHPVTVFVRESSDRTRLDGLDVDYIVGDLMDADSVKAAVGGRGFRYVVDATARRNMDDLFYENAMRNMLAALADSDVQQFILHGSVGAGANIENFPDIPFGRMVTTLEDKGRAEDALRASGINYTIIRNGRVMRNDPPATGNAQLSEDDTILSSITRADLALLTVECLDNPRCMKKTFHAVDTSL